MPPTTPERGTDSWASVRIARAYDAYPIRYDCGRAAAVRLFHYSLLYLALLFVAMAIDTVVI